MKGGKQSVTNTNRGYKTVSATVEWRQSMVYIYCTPTVVVDCITNGCPTTVHLTVYRWTLAMLQQPVNVHFLTLY